jgi:hypothetical protein
LGDDIALLDVYFVDTGKAAGANKSQS